ncbi:hypothetical protein I3843_15G094400 [Carya illinoinensis]|nr:hypothetical protein I3843_15G094400 [Carya illinoinensis]KAG7944325.1 hypothetical protein I3843_15G094400 [Carya illinoinensis]
MARLVDHQRVQVLAFEAGRIHKIRVNTISAGCSFNHCIENTYVFGILNIYSHYMDWSVILETTLPHSRPILNRLNILNASC